MKFIQIALQRERSKTDGHYSGIWSMTQLGFYEYLPIFIFSFYYVK